MTPATPLPPLRDELDLLPGPALPDGQPSWTLHDPVRNLFFQIDWASFEILQRWRLRWPGVIARRIQAETTLRAEPDDVEAMHRFLAQHELLQPAALTAAELAGQRQRRRAGWSQWLLHNYLFFRVPLLRPDRWLTRWTPRLAFLYGPAFRWLTLAALLAGMWGVSRSWDAFTATLVDMLSWEGLAAYGLTLAAVKTLHEFGHGVTAKRYGCRVPTMGVAFLVLWPVAYTDTNEVWKLTRRDQRLKVAAAGIATELTIAVWAMLAWVWLPDGPLRAMAFLLATTTWVSTLLINASPFMRFDGYFLLSDFLQMPNLHARAFALARWDLRERLFALGEPAPEHFPAARRRGLILFAWATWIYRLVLFLGIAALVYHFFIKALGIFLFLVEIVWFIARPLWSEIGAWRQRGAAIGGSRRARWSALLLILIVLGAFAPWPVPVRGSGLLQAREQWPLHAPEASRLASPPPAEGHALRAHEDAFMLDTPSLAASAAQSQARSLQLARQSAAAGFDPELRRDWQVLRERQAEAQAQQVAVDSEAARYRLEAPGAGRLRDRDPDLRQGDWLGRRELLGRVVSAGPLQVVAYVPEDALPRLRAGQTARFIADGGAGPDLDLRVRSIDQDATRVLQEAVLSAPAGGDVQVRASQNLLYPERPVYRVMLDVESADPPAQARQHSWRGRVSIHGDWEAPGARLLRTAASVFWREAGF